MENQRRRVKCIEGGTEREEVKDNPHLSEDKTT